MFKKVILENQRKIKSLALIERDLDIEEIISIFSLDKIFSLIWSRRAGKTFLTFQIVKSLIKKGLMNIEQVIYLDFSWFIEKDIDLEKLLEDYFVLFPDTKPTLIFDEVGELSNFPEKLITMLNRWYKIIITWSNAHLLSKEISTILRWKVYTKEVFPLSFKEFLKFKNIDYLKKDFIENTAKYKKLFLEYMKWGGFPEITLIDNEIAKENILKTYMDVMIYKDLQDRYNIKNDFALKFIIKKILFSYSKELNINKIFNELKSQNLKISKDTLYSFYEYLQDIYFVEKINNYRAKLKWFSKPYLIDVSFSNYIWNEDLGRRFENIVFWELKKRFSDIYFLSRNYEIDFFVPEKNIFIQVVYNLNQDNYKRELQNLSKQDGQKIVIFFEKQLNIVVSEDILFIDIWEFIFDKFLTDSK